MMHGIQTYSTRNKRPVVVLKKKIKSICRKFIGIRLIARQFMLALFFNIEPHLKLNLFQIKKSKTKVDPL